MKRLRWQFSSVVAVALCVISATTLGQAASVSVDQPYAGDRNVTGQAISGSTPLTVYEVLGTTRNYLGKSSSLDQQGFYAVNISPVLIAGHQIVVVDGQGHSSGIMTVVVKAGPAGPAN